ncbi:hypothetical protein GCM10023330_09240 [Litoribaculum gwangyangense]|uniref:Secretion system C-terminal sorting domain-containing protein n=2 Tax=Litoribaculum gwangyangense TaxID=1130722 RepID=A0ABP9C5P5_9FLAO
MSLRAQEKAIIGVTSGNTNNLGTIFKTDINGDNFTVLQQLAFKYEGEYPGNIKLCEYNGVFYGTTDQGGANDSGVIFSYNPVTEEYLKLFDFEYTVSGSSPSFGLILANNDFMYGITSSGGSNNTGTMYKFNPQTNNVEIIYHFNQDDGAHPNAPLIQADNGNLYGLTNLGGTNNNGVLFQYNLSTNTFSKLLDFESITSGAGPAFLMQASNGKLYGISLIGGINDKGTLFSYDLNDFSFIKLFDFDGADSGSRPYSGLMEASNGYLYGTTNQGGLSNFGTIFKYELATSTFNKLIDLDTSMGWNATGDLIEAPNGKLYGLMGYGGLNWGVLYELDILNNDSYNKIFQFPSQKEGSLPSGTLTLFNNKLYGTTRLGGLGLGSGTLFEFNLDNQQHTKKIDFNYADMGSGFSKGFTKGLNDKLYIATGGGGEYSKGTLLEYNPDDNSLIKKYDFEDRSSNQIYVYASNGKLYGINDYELFEFDLETSTYTPKISFINSIIYALETPTGIIEAVNGKIYGMTRNGGLYYKGNIFEYDYVNDIYLNLFDFDGTNTGSLPSGNLIQASNGKLYGLLTYEGANNKDVLFEFDIESKTYSKKFDFTALLYQTYRVSLSELESGILYGFTWNGGVYNNGGIFQYNLNTNSFTKKIDFNTQTPGYGFQENFLKTSENKAFILNGSSGSTYQGSLFEYNPNINTLTGKFNFSSDNVYAVGSLIEININSSLSVEKNKDLKAIYIYPNPVADKLIISSKNPEAFQIKIYDFLGKQVFLKNAVFANDELKLTHLQSGLYILKATSKSGNTQTIKFIKN